MRWLFEQIEDGPDFEERRMFGCQVAYLHGRMMLATVEKDEPWNGLLVCTSREHHGSLQAEFPSLAPHEILGKWLYLSQTHPQFEAIAEKLARYAVAGDERLGIESKPKKRPRPKARF